VSSYIEIIFCGCESSKSSPALFRGSAARGVLATIWWCLAIGASQGPRKEHGQLRPLPAMGNPRRSEPRATLLFCL